MGAIIGHCLVRHMSRMDSGPFYPELWLTKTTKNELNSRSIAIGLGYSEPAPMRMDRMDLHGWRRSPTPLQSLVRSASLIKRKSQSKNYTARWWAHPVLAYSNFVMLIVCLIVFKWQLYFLHVIIYFILQHTLCHYHGHTLKHCCIFLSFFFIKQWLYTFYGILTAFTRW